MKIILNVLVLVGFALALYITTRTFEIPHQEYQEDTSLFLYDRGNASPEVRAEVLQQLELVSERIYREGYFDPGFLYGAVVFQREYPDPGDHARGNLFRLRGGSRPGIFRLALLGRCDHAY